MDAHLRAPSPRFLLLSLDGLSALQLNSLSSRLPVLARLMRDGDLKVVDTRPACNPQSIWAELLTGQRWNEAGCPGYARPAGSLNDQDIVIEESLSHPVQLLASRSDRVHLTINIPLLQPKPGRIWLSDGSSPMQTTVSPVELSALAPFSAYKARPFACTTAAFCDQYQSILSCLQLERQRLICALELIRQQPWQSCFLRVSAFDLLAHLIGPEFLLGEELSVWPQISAFLDDFNRILTQIYEQCSDTVFCVLSSFSHARCRARLNLNELLASGGFCQLDPTPFQSELLAGSRRVESWRAVAATSNEVPPQARPLVSQTNSFNLAKTLAGSPVQGAIYLNRKSRFNGGIVDDYEAASILEGLTAYVKTQLEKEFGDTFQLSRSAGADSIAPDLMVYAGGVEIHNSAGPPVVDRDNRPRSTHDAEGFVWLQRGLGHLPARVEPVDIHNVLKEVVL